MPDQQLLIGITLLAGVGIALYLSQTNEEERRRNDPLSEEQNETLRELNKIDGELTAISGEYDYMIKEIVERAEKTDDYKYLDYFRKFHPAEYDTLIKFQQQVKRLQGRFAMLQNQNEHNPEMHNYNWERQADFLNELEFSVDSFIEQLGDNEKHRDAKVEEPKIQIQNVFYKQEIFNQQQNIDARQQQANIFQQQNTKIEYQHQPTPMSIDTTPEEDAFLQNSRDNPGGPGIPRLTKSAPVPRLGGGRREDEPQLSQSGFNQGSGTTQNMERESAKPPPPEKGQYGAFSEDELQMPKRLKQPEYYVKICRTLYDIILKTCQNAPGADRNTQKRLVTLYKKISKNFFFLKKAIDADTRKPQQIEGAMDVLFKCKRCATQIYDILGFDVRRGFTEAQYSQPSNPKKRERSPQKAPPAKRSRTEFDQTPALPTLSQSNPMQKPALFPNQPEAGALTTQAGMFQQTN